MKDNQDFGMHQEDSVPLLRDERVDDPRPASDQVLPSRTGTGTETATKQADVVSGYVLPLAFLASLAMASTAATTLFAYAALLCKDSRHCKENETSHYAGFTAGATSISNIVGMAALGYLQKIAANGKAGLMLWLTCRSMSVAMLLVGGKFRAHIF